MPKTPRTTSRRRSKAAIDTLRPVSVPQPTTPTIDERHTLPALNSKSLPSGSWKDGKLTRDGLTWITKTYMIHLTCAKQHRLISADMHRDPTRRIKKIAKSNPHPDNSEDETENEDGPKWFCYVCETHGLRIDRTLKHEVTDIHRGRVADALEIPESKLPELELYRCTVECCDKVFRRKDQLSAHMKSHTRTRKARTVPKIEELEDLKILNASNIHSESADVEDAQSISRWTRDDNACSLEEPHESNDEYDGGSIEEDTPAHRLDRGSRSRGSNLPTDSSIRVPKGGSQKAISEAKGIECTVANSAPDIKPTRLDLESLRSQRYADEGDLLSPLTETSSGSLHSRSSSSNADPLTPPGSPADLCSIPSKPRFDVHADPWYDDLSDDHPTLSAEALFEQFCIYPDSDAV